MLRILRSRAMFDLSVLDLAPVVSGSSPADALRTMVDLARACERLGYARYWLAEHHNASGLASSVPEILIGHVASATKTIRVGAGGIMLPNHAPLHVAEAFATLEALHPGRIDLGLGRAPGTDKNTARALRGMRDGDKVPALVADDFPQQLTELRRFLVDDFPGGDTRRRVHVSPALGTPPPLWLLGSSEFSGQLAAEEGVGFAFAHHINPTLAVAALREYRQMYKCSNGDARPHAILATTVICAETEERARELALPSELMWLRSGRGERGPLPTLEEAKAYAFDADETQLIAFGRDRQIVGTPETVGAKLRGLAAEAQADEIMLLSLIADPEARKSSYALVQQALSPLKIATGARDD